MNRTLASTAAIALAALVAGGSAALAQSSSGSPAPAPSAVTPPSSFAPPEGAQQGKAVTFVSPLVGHPVWLQAKDGFERRSGELQMTPTWTGPQGVDIAENVRQVEAALASGADGIVTCALDPAAFSGVLDEAAGQGVPVVLTDCESERPDQRLAFVGTIGHSFGAQSGEKLAELTGGSARIIQMQGQADAKIQNDIFDGFTSAIEAYPDMQVLVREIDDSDTATAVTKFEALFRTYPDATVVYCIEASCAGAAATVAEEQGLLDQLLIFGTDDTAETLAGIRAGSIEITAAQDFTLMGELAAQYLSDHFNGLDVPSVTDTGVVFITADNVDTYLTE